MYAEVFMSELFFFADKAADFTGKGRLGGEQKGKETQEEDCSPTWLVLMSELS